MREACQILLCLVFALATGAGCSHLEEHTLRLDLAREGLALRNVPGDNPEAQRAGTAFPKSPELSDLLRHAALHNPGLRAAYHRWRAAVEKAAQARSLPAPRISYTHYIEEVETRVGPQKNRLMLMQMVPWPAKLLRKSDRAIRQAMVERHLYEGEKLALFYRVRKAYWEYAFLARSIAVVRDSIAFLENTEGALQTRFKTGTIESPALLQIQVELGKLEERLQSLQALQPAMAAKVNAAIGRDTGQPLPWPTELMPESPPLDEVDLLQALREANPALHAARQRIHATDAGLRLARAQYLPDFGLGATVIETDRRTDMDPSGNGKDPVMLTLEMSLPIWWGKYRAGVREAEARRQAAQSQLQEKTHALSASLRLALFHYEDAGRKRDLFRDTLIPKAEQGLGAARTAFTAGKAAFSDLIDAERTLLELRLMAARARVDRQLRLAELESLAGRDLRQPPMADTH